MNYNIAIILFGCGLVFITLLISLKGGNKEESEFSPEILLGLNSSKINNSLDTLRQQEIVKEIEVLRSEMSHMKKELQNITDLLVKEVEPAPVAVASAAVNNWENFDQSLNYNIFMQKNNDIINSYNEGMSSEEIARKFSKSVREVEMVIKLIR